jgi:hypothetical protein
MLEELKTLYDEYEAMFDYARDQWEETRVEANRKENYWQGKKDGHRVDMNLLCALIRDRDPEFRIHKHNEPQ